MSMKACPKPVRVMLRPILARREQLTYVHYVCQQITEALKQFPALFLKSAQIREILAVSDEESSWLQGHLDAGPCNATIRSMARLDAVCDFASAGWQDTLKFMEPNLSGVGGIHYSPVAEQMVMRDIVPTLMAHDPELVHRASARPTRPVRAASDRPCPVDGPRHLPHLLRRAEIRA